MEDDDGVEVGGEGTDDEGWGVRGGFALGCEL